jgi:hypothetical protein
MESHDFPWDPMGFSWEIFTRADPSASTELIIGIHDVNMLTGPMT